MLALKNKDVDHYPLVEHAEKSGHQIEWGRVEILGEEKNLKKRLLLESWFMGREATPINRQNGVTHSPIYTWLLQNVAPQNTEKVVFEYKF